MIIHVCWFYVTRRFAIATRFVIRIVIEIVVKLMLKYNIKSLQSRNDPQSNLNCYYYIGHMSFPVSDMLLQHACTCIYQARFRDMITFPADGDSARTHLPPSCDVIGPVATEFRLAGFVQSGRLTGIGQVRGEPKSSASDDQRDRSDVTNRTSCRAK